MTVFYVVCIAAYRVASVWRSYHIAPVWLISPHSMMVAHLLPQTSVVANPVIVVYCEIVLASYSVVSSMGLLYFRRRLIERASGKKKSIAKTPPFHAHTYVH